MRPNDVSPRPPDPEGMFIQPAGQRTFVPPVMADEGWADADTADSAVSLLGYAHKLWLHRWKIVLVALAGTLLAGGWSATRPKLYRASSKISMQSGPRLSNSQFDQGFSYWESERYIKSQIEVLRSRKLGVRVARVLGLDKGDDSLEATGQALAGSIQVAPIEGTNVLVLSLVSTAPDRAAEWLNVYIQEYVKTNIEDSLEQTRQVYEVIQSRLDPLREEVTNSEQALLKFREREDTLFFAEQEKSVITQQVDKLTSEYADTKAERIRLESKLNVLRESSPKEVDRLSFPEVANDPSVQSLLEQRRTLQVALNDKLRTLKPGHPEVQEMQGRLAALDAGISDQIRTITSTLQKDYDIVRQRESSLYSNIQQLKEQTIELSKQTLEYGRLQREYEQNKRFLEDMMARSKEADISQTGLVNNVRVIEPAISPAGAFSPNIPRSAGIGLVLGLLLGVGLVLGVDLLDQTLRTPEDVQRWLGLEVLSTLPKMGGDNTRVLREAFQSLRTALILASRGEGCQVLLVTSAVPEEGKTTVTFNLAKVLAAAGSRVLLIDADLRKPRLHRFVSTKNVRGLTSVVLGERDTTEVIQAYSEVPNLDLITSGPLPPNPPELFGKASFRSLIEWARSTYDWVLIDTPPVTSVTDAVMCATSVDMALLVVQYGGPKRGLVREAIRLLSRTGTLLPGAVLNKIDLERDHYYYSTYYSYYQYGHYGSEETTKSKPGRKVKRKPVSPETKAG